jgi:hypothetical protein
MCNKSTQIRPVHVQLWAYARNPKLSGKFKWEFSVPFMTSCVQAEIWTNFAHIMGDYLIITYLQGRIYARAKGARAQGDKFPGAAY